MEDKDDGFAEPPRYTEWSGPDKGTKSWLGWITVIAVNVILWGSLYVILTL